MHKIKKHLFLYTALLFSHISSASQVPQIEDASSYIRTFGRAANPYRAYLEDPAHTIEEKNVAINKMLSSSIQFLKNFKEDGGTIVHFLELWQHHVRNKERLQHMEDQVVQAYQNSGESITIAKTVNVMDIFEFLHKRCRFSEKKNFIDFIRILFNEVEKDETIKPKKRYEERVNFLDTIATDRRVYRSTKPDVRSMALELFEGSANAKSVASSASKQNELQVVIKNTLAYERRKKALAQDKMRKEQKEKAQKVKEEKIKEQLENDRLRKLEQVQALAFKKEQNKLKHDEAQKKSKIKKAFQCMELVLNTHKSSQVLHQWSQYCVTQRRNESFEAAEINARKHLLQNVLKTWKKKYQDSKSKQQLIEFADGVSLRSLLNDEIDVAFATTFFKKKLRKETREQAQRATIMSNMILSAHVRSYPQSRSIEGLDLAGLPYVSCKMSWDRNRLLDKQIYTNYDEPRLWVQKHLRAQIESNPNTQAVVPLELQLRLGGNSRLLPSQICTVCRTYNWIQGIARVEK